VYEGSFFPTSSATPVVGGVFFFYLFFFIFLLLFICAYKAWFIVGGVFDDGYSNRSEVES
jgi:hypothetical protein